VTDQHRHDTRLDRFVDSYSQRTEGMRVSAVRALFSVANRPEIVSLAGGMPNIKDLPLHHIADSLAAMIETNGTKVMQYGSGQGEGVLREQIVDVMALESITAHPDDITITAGSQQGLDLVTRIFCDPGDVVLAESPSYVGALGTFLSYQCEVVHVPTDEHGISPTALRETIDRLRARGKRIKFLYTIPNYNNPSGVTQPWDRRLDVISVCEGEGALSASRTTRTVCCRWTRTPSPRCARPTRTSSTSVPSPRRSPPDSASDGCSPPTRCARSSCWRRSRRRCARRCSASTPSRTT